MATLMFKLLFAITIVTFAAIQPRAQSNKSDREQAGLKGPVKSVRSSSVDYSGDKIVGEGFMKTPGDFILYDEAGREIDRKPVSDFGEAMGVVSRKFDQLGMLIESSWVDTKGKLLKKDVFNYSNGKLHETLTYNGSGILIEKTVRTYDDIGRLAAEIYYDPTNAVARTTYKYDTKNQPIEIAFFLADGRKATAPVGPCLGAHRVTFVYNKKGQAIAKTAFEDNGMQKKSYRWKYDGSGSVIEYLTKTEDSTVNFVYKYEFDKNGNWIKQIATGTSLEKGLTVFGKPDTPYVRTTVTSREITYF